jgi:hypothetical protein
MRQGVNVTTRLSGSAEVMNIWSYISSPQYVFMEWHFSNYALKEYVIAGSIHIAKITFGKKQQSRGQSNFVNVLRSSNNLNQISLTCHRSKKVTGKLHCYSHSHTCN